MCATVKTPSRVWDSNPQPSAYKADALPIEPTRRAASPHHNTSGTRTARGNARNTCRQCARWDSNPHARRTPEPKSGVSTNSTTGTLTYSIFARPPPKGQPVRPAGLEPTHPNKRGTGLSIRRVYQHSATGTIHPASPGGRLGTMRTQYHAHRLARKPTTRAHTVTYATLSAHETGRGKYRAPCGPCRTRTCDILARNQALYPLS